MALAADNERQNLVEPQGLNRRVYKAPEECVRCDDEESRIDDPVAEGVPVELKEAVGGRLIDACRIVDFNHPGNPHPCPFGRRSLCSRRISHIVLSVQVDRDALKFQRATKWLALTCAP